MPLTDFANLPSAYDHAAAQEKWYPFWESKGYFHADDSLSGDGADKPPFSVVIPPPNVTGALHLGHALNNTLQDILCRWKRMQGFNVLWMPGTDHAGIATQARVEKRLLETEGKSRHDLGREGLVERIWEWKDQYEGRILGQLKQLGCSCDWDRTRFTLDDQCARAVRETFFKLFADGKIYRGKRLVNWDTYLQTAVSDDEVFHEEKKGHFWHFHYPVVDPQSGEPTSVEIATTRPETMLGDTAVAVHPDPAKQLDKVATELKQKLAAAKQTEREPIEKQLEALAERRATMLPKLLQLRDMAARGVQLELPLCDRKIPLIADIWAKPELGSGCVKITPAHDPNDYDVWQRSISGDGQDIGAINIMQPDGTLADTVPQKFRGLTMKKARTAVIEALAEVGAHDPDSDVEDRLIDLAHSDRSKTPIEPYLADQWFVKMGEGSEGPGAGEPGLAQSAMDAVTSGKVKILPDRYTKTYLDWLSEKRDWPVGRQLWWGHRIPVWTKTWTSKEAAELYDELPDNDSVTDEVARVQMKGLDSSVVRSQWKRDDAAGTVISYDCVAPGNPDLEKNLAERGCVQSEEVLDTWFSSALWPFSTLGWPEETTALQKFYPTSTLITSRDIITLWVARMVLMGEYNRDQIPFHEVFIHPKILDGFGETMSKSKGNGVDPLDVIEKFGADALRFGIAYLTTETQDVRMPVEFVCPHCDQTIKQTKKNRILPVVACTSCSKPFSTQWAETDEDRAHARGAVTSERFELGRNFCNKLWNASRFALQNLEGYQPQASAPGELRIEDRWLLSRLATVTQQVTDALGSYRYADAARTLYDFAWNEFCSFYVEMTKSRFASDGEQTEGADKIVAQRVLAHGLDTLLRLLHPITPFLTEEVWSLLAQVVPTRGGDDAALSESVCVAKWPEADEGAIDATIESQFAVFQAVLGAVREVRQSQNIAWTETLNFVVKCDAQTAALLEPMTPYFAQMAKARPFSANGATTMGADAVPADIVVSRTLEGELTGIEVHVDVAAFIDVEAETARLSKELGQKEKFVKSLAGKLANEKFVANAPAEVVEQERAKLAEATAAVGAIQASLEKLNG